MLFSNKATEILSKPFILLLSRRKEVDEAFTFLCLQIVLADKEHFFINKNDFERHEAYLRPNKDIL